MKIIIIEDEVIAAEHLRNLLTQCKPDITVIQELRSVKNSVQWLKNNANTADLILMDIRLTDGICFDIFEALPTLKTPIIFTTAYDDFAIEAFQFNSVQYLLKPISKEALQLALDKFLRFHNQQNMVIDYQKLAAQINPTKNYKTRFLIKQGNHLNIIKIQHTAYFYTQNDLTFLATFDNKKYALSQSLSTLEKELNPYFFFRLTRNVIAHIEAIESVQPFSKGRLTVILKPSGLDRIIVSSDRTSKFKEWVAK